MNEICKLPPRLYKYRPIDKFTSDIFCRRVLWFSRPDSFTDPYDCVPVLKVEIDEEGFRDHLISTWAANHPEWVQDELIAAVAREMEDNFPPTKDELDRFREEYRNRLRSVGVFSVSERADSVVMWSHYADGHRGICLELDPSVLPPTLGFHKTIYQENRPVINVFRDWKIANRLASGIKSREWKYECEWRLVLEANDNTPQFPCEIDLPEGMLTGVVLGERIEAGDKDRVIDWCNDVSERPAIYEATLDRALFQINRNAIKSNEE